MNYDKRFLEQCEKLGKNIKKLREEKHITIKELSRKSGIRTEYLNKIEQGQAYGVLIDKHLLKIAESLNVRLSCLFNFKHVTFLNGENLPYFFIQFISLFTEVFINIVWN